MKGWEATKRSSCLALRPTGKGKSGIQGRQAWVYTTATEPWTAAVSNEQSWLGYRKIEVGPSVPGSSCLIALDKPKDGLTGVPPDGYEGGVEAMSSRRKV